MSEPFVWPAVHQVGAGSFGSVTALLLVKAGVRNLHVYDDDRVEPRNIENQLYTDFQIGTPKVQALTWILDALGAVRPRVYAARLSALNPQGAVVICAVDNMASRRSLFESCNLSALFIDGRIGGDVARLYFIRPDNADDRSFYARTLYGDDEATGDPCLSGAAISTCWAAASFVASNLLKFCKGEPCPREIILDHRTLTISSQ